MISPKLLTAISVVLLVTACQSPEEAARAAFSNRLKGASKLTKEEKVRILGEVNRAIEGKTIKIKRGDAVEALDSEQHEAIFGMLSAPDAVEDAGPHAENGVSWRGLETDGPSLRPDVGAKRVLWVEVQTFIPRRYELVSAVPAHGDSTYDLVVER